MTTPNEPATAGDKQYHEGQCLRCPHRTIRHRMMQDGSAYCQDCNCEIKY